MDANFVCHLLQLIEEVIVIFLFNWEVLTVLGMSVLPSATVPRK